MIIHPELQSFMTHFKNARDLKKAYEVELAKVKDLVRTLKPFLTSIEKKARASRPDIFELIESGYAEGESIVNDMMRGGRWPIKYKGETYFEILCQVPDDQRSPEIHKAIAAWGKFKTGSNELNRLFPPPDLFWWNGTHLIGPNLYPAFGISTEC